MSTENKPKVGDTYAVTGDGLERNRAIGDHRKDRAVKKLNAKQIKAGVAAVQAAVDAIRDARRPETHVASVEAIRAVLDRYRNMHAVLTLRRSDPTAECTFVPSPVVVFHYDSPTPSIGSCMVDGELVVVDADGGTLVSEDRASEIAKGIADACWPSDDVLREALHWAAVNASLRGSLDTAHDLLSKANNRRSVCCCGV